MLKKDAMDILLGFLDKKTREAEEEIKEKGILSDDKAIPLILKTQFNHIAHLESMVDERFEQVERRFEQVERRFEQVERRFEQVDRRFDEIRSDMDKRFGEVKADMDRRFEQVDVRFSRLERNLFSGFAFLGFLITFYRFIH